MAKKSSGKGIHWKTLLLVVLLVVIGGIVAWKMSSDVRLSAEEITPEGDVSIFDESEVLSLTGEEFDDDLSTSFDDEYTSNESEDDAEAWEDYYASCGDDGSASESGSDDASNTGSDDGSSSSCESAPECTPQPEVPVVKTYSSTKRISGKGDAQTEIASLFSQAAAARSTVSAGFTCLEEDKCKKKNTGVTYSLSIVPVSAEPCDSAWSQTFDRTFNAQGVATICHARIQQDVSDWTFRTLSDLRDPCPKCSYYTTTTYVPQSNEADTSCSTDASFKVTCGPKKQGDFFKGYSYTFKLDVYYTYSCIPIPLAS